MANFINKREIKDSDIVKIIKINNELRVVHNSFNNHFNRMRKIDKNTGINLETGEIIEFKRSKNRSERLCDFKRSLSELRDIIKTNVTELNKCFFITLTYKENISDRKILSKNFDSFKKMFKRHFGNYKYIKVNEYQQRGAIHCHLIVIFDETPSFLITTDEIDKCWKHGSTNVGPIVSADAVAKYLTNYLFEYDENNNDLSYELKSKKQRKGERLPFNESHKKLYSTSQNIKKPLKIKMTYEEFNDMFDSVELINSLSLYNDDSNIVTIENYKIINGKEVC